MTLCRERTAVQQLMEVAKDTKSGGPAEGAHVHVVHLSDAEETLSLIKVYLLSHLWFWLYLKQQLPFVGVLIDIIESFWWCLISMSKYVEFNLVLPRLLLVSACHSGLHSIILELETPHCSYSDIYWFYRKQRQRGPVWLWRPVLTTLHLLLKTYQMVPQSINVLHHWEMLTTGNFSGNHYWLVIPCCR